MSRLAPLFLAFLAVLSPGFAAEPSAGVNAWAKFQKQAALALEQAQRERGVVEALPDGVEELRFQDFFKPVIGDRGPEYTERIRSLHGKKVRVQGFMVREQSRKAGVFMLAPWPTRIESDGFCVYEDFPPATLHVLLPEGDQRTAPFKPGLLSVIGVLEVRPAPMPDGRNCVASLRLENSAVLP